MDGPHSAARRHAPRSAGGRTAQASGHCGGSALRKIPRFSQSEHVHKRVSPDRQLLADLEGAGLDELQISVDRMTPIPSTRKAMKSIVHKLDWFKDSKVKLNVSGVLFKETLDQMGQVIDTCLDLGIPVDARVVDG